MLMSGAGTRTCLLDLVNFFVSQRSESCGRAGKDVVGEKDKCALWSGFRPTIVVMWRAKQRYSISGCSNRQDKPEHSASRRIPGYPQASTMSLDNRSANRQPHSDSFAFARKERLEDAFQCFRFDSWAGVLDSNNTFSGRGRL